jgi:hypothetical protein
MVRGDRRAVHDAVPEKLGQETIARGSFQLGLTHGKLIDLRQQPEGVGAGFHAARENGISAAERSTIRSAT